MNPELMQQAWEAEGLALLTSDSHSARTEIYQRLLYGDRWSAFVASVLKENPSAVPRATTSFLETINYERLGVEQRARTRNLRSVLSRNCPSLVGLIGPDAHLELTKGFVNWTEFWTPKGRTLTENFCLYAHASLLARGDRFASEVAHLCGVISGLKFAPSSPSPWTAVKSTQTLVFPVEGAIAAESFVTIWQLIDQAGNVPSAENLAYVSLANKQRIVVIHCMDGKISFLSLKHQGEG
jgi:hypothetical protein